MTDTIKGVSTEALRTRALRIVTDRLRGEEREVLVELIRLYENGLRAARMFNSFAAPEGEAPRSEPRRPPPAL